MRNVTLMAMLFLLALPAAAQQKGDAAGCKDDPIFPTRMPGFRIEKCETKPFGDYEFHTVKPPKKRVEGQVTFVQYTVDRKEDDRDAVEVVRNYENALKKIGAKIQGVVPRWWVNGTLTIDGREVWAEAEKGNGKIWLHIVRSKAMEQAIVANAAALADDLRTAGHVAVDGVLFDTGKATLKPESQQAIGEMTKLLKADAGLKVFVVGHTDTVGSVDSNLKLSELRAAAVVQALVANGIAATRLRPFGNGPFAPVGSNATEEGRGRNRRVELVKQ